MTTLFERGKMCVIWLVYSYVTVPIMFSICSPRTLKPAILGTLFFRQFVYIKKISAQ